MVRLRKKEIKKEKLQLIRVWTKCHLMNITDKPKLEVDNLKASLITETELEVQHVLGSRMSQLITLIH